jgi:ABC-type multidrug transport system fused ATPase/permease subunit
VLFQDTFLFADTILNNIRFGRPEASEEAVIEGGKESPHPRFCYATGKWLPISWSRRVQRTFPGGQRQRLGTGPGAALRSHLFLLLDDPSSAVDSKTEKAIFEAIDDTIRSRTTFMVAHSVSTLKRADRIMVLKHGKIVQDGTHEHLLSQPGLYRDAALLQDHKSPTQTLGKSPQEALTW